MRAVWKFPFHIADTVVLELPVGADGLYFGADPEKPGSETRVAIWALVDTEAEKESRTFYVRGTGHPVEDNLDFRATVAMPPFVWHLFEEIEV